MQFLPKFLSQLRTLTYLIENPTLFRIYAKGGIITVYRILDQPWFRDLEIASVIDIGANVGQFAYTVSAVLPEVHIYSFEPIPDCFQELQQRMKGSGNFTSFNFGLGDQEDELEFECNDFSPASSFLKTTELNKRVYPFTDRSKRIKLQIKTLDEVVNTLEISEPMLIKIDVQGYEDKVLKGGEQTVRRAKAILIETSFDELYRNQPLFNDLYQLITSWGFRYIGSIEQTCDPQSGRILQADGLFLKLN